MSNAILKIKANKTAFSQSSGDRGVDIDAGAKFVFAVDEGAPDIVSVRTLSQMFIMDGKPNVNSYAAKGMAWQIILTDRRVAFWSPQHSPIFGGLKEKAGVATGGHCAYAETKQINLNAEEGGISVIYEINGETTTTLVTLIDDGPETLSRVANLLAAHLETWLSGSNASIIGEALAAMRSYDFASAPGELDLNITAGSNGNFTIIPVGEGIKGISYGDAGDEA